MTLWTETELNKLENTDELRIATLRRDGTLRKWVIIWMIRLNDDIYIRSANGREGVWFRGAITRHEGRIKAGGVEKDVQLVEEDNAEINAQIDEAYLAKYGRYPQYVAPMVVPKAKAATLRLVPRLAD